MRAVCFVKRLEWDVPGTVYRHAIAIGDIDNDGENELVIGNTEGEMYIFKGEELWQKITDLGFITCVAVGDVFNYGRNALVIIRGDGWVNIYYCAKSVNPSSNNLFGSKQSAQASLDSSILSSNTIAANFTSNFATSQQTESNTENCDGSAKLECVHVQRIPPNTKVVLIADVDKDSLNEMVIGLTDRVVRSYRWSTNIDSENGRLVGLNKWECANQIGTITLQHSANGTPTLLVAQPGGTLMKIKCNPDDCFIDEASDANSEVAASYVNYQTLQSAQMRNPNISTEVLGDLKLLIEDTQMTPPVSPKIDDVNFETILEKKNYSTKIESLSNLDNEKSNTKEVDQVDGNIMGGNIILGELESNDKKTILPTFKDFVINEKNDENNDDTKFTSISDTVNDNAINESNPELLNITNPYALATLDGTIILMKDEIVLWAIQVDHHLFALCRLDVTGNGADEIIACAWDGQTYILDQNKNCVRFQFEEPVMAFCTGMYNTDQKTATPCFVYKTFNNKVFLYYDVTLKSMTLQSLDPFKQLDKKNKEALGKIFKDSNEKTSDKKLRELTRWLLYRKSK